MNPNKFLKIFLLSFLLIAAHSYNASAQIDSVAVAILDNMSNITGNLKSCSFNLRAKYDIYNDQLGLVKFSDDAKVFLQGPDKLLVNRKGDKGNKDYYYNGKTFTYYSFDNNQYATVEAPPTIIELIDNFHNNYGIDFPATDVFYPDFVGDVLASAINLSYLGLTSVDDVECFHIAGTSIDMTYQIWIDKTTLLPMKIGIVYANKTANPQYEAMYSQWNLNPSFDVSMFNFTAPEKAREIKFIKISEK